MEKIEKKRGNSHFTYLLFFLKNANITKRLKKVFLAVQTEISKIVEILEV